MEAPRKAEGQEKWSLRAISQLRVWTRRNGKFDELPPTPRSLSHKSKTSPLVDASNGRPTRQLSTSDSTDRPHLIERKHLNIFPSLVFHEMSVFALRLHDILDRCLRCSNTPQTLQSDACVLSFFETAGSLRLKYSNNVFLSSVRI